SFAVSIISLSCFLCVRGRVSATLFPYTTLFRSSKHPKTALAAQRATGGSDYFSNSFNRAGGRRDLARQPFASLSDRHGENFGPRCRIRCKVGPDKSH